MLIASFLTLFACESDKGVAVHNSTPEISITSHSAEEEILEDQVQTFEAMVSDGNHQTSDLLVSWSTNQRTLCDALPPSETGSSTCAAALTAEETLVRAQVSDPKGATSTADIELVVTATAAPAVQIISPSGGTNYYSDQLILFSAIITDAEDSSTDLDYTWESSIDGKLNTTVQPDEDGELEEYLPLTEGDHAITLSVEDSSGKITTESVSITVGGPNTIPACEIVSPTDNDVFTAGETIVFIATAADPETADLELSWQSNKDGDLGTGVMDSNGEVTLTYSGLSSDTHTISFQATDDMGGTCIETIVISVGTPPSIALDLPTIGDVFAAGDVVSFEGTVSDNEEIPSNVAISWDSDIDGEFSTQAANSDGSLLLSTSGLSAGLHSITVTATDSLGLTDSAVLSIRINSLPSAPTVNLAPNPAYTSDSIIAYASGSTDSDGQNISYSYQWLQNGVVTSHSSASLPSSATTKGELWTVRITPNDGYQDGLYGEDSLTIQNSQPSIDSLSLSSTSPTTSDSLTCTGTVSDADGDTLTTTYTWTNAQTGALLGSSDTLTLSPLWSSPGDSIQCTLEVSDGDHSTSQSTVAYISNQAPTISLSITPSSPVIGDELYCLATVTEPDLESYTTSYLWTNLSTGAVLGNGESISLDPTLNDPNDTIDCTVTVNDTSGGSATTNVTTNIINQDPSIDSIELNPSSPSIGDTVECLVSASDADGDIPSLTYTWTNVTTNTTIANTASLLLEASMVSVSDEINCAVTAADSYGATAIADISTSILPTAPIFTIAAAISPATNVASNSTLTCSATAIDPDGGAVTISYAWSNTTTGSSLGSGTTLTLSSSIVQPNDVVECTVTATDSDSESSTSSATVSVMNTAPSIDSVTLTPEPLYTDDTITASITTSDPDNTPLTETYTWYVDGSMVQSGTSNSLNGFAYFDRDQQITVEVVVNDGTADSPVVNASLDCQNSLPQAPTVSITPADPIEGDSDLTCAVDISSSDLDNDTITYDFTWTVDGVVFSGATNSGMSSVVSVNTPVAGELWTCTVTPNDGTDNGTSTSASVTIASDWGASITFTTCGKSGHTGPSQSECDSEYSGTNIENQVSVSGGIQNWTVPANGDYIIEVSGAKGGQNTGHGWEGGDGATMIGTFTLTAGDTLQILVGQMGTAGGDNAGGGGGTFVVQQSGNTPLIIAGGGGGGAENDDNGSNMTTYKNGVTTECGQASPKHGGGENAATCGGQGGGCDSIDYGQGGGGGFYSDGAGTQPGYGFVNGGEGANPRGGFGGGGNGAGDGGGGAGGYSGGAGGSGGGSPDGPGGGGGSYNVGSNQSNTSGSNTGHGYVIIDRVP